MARKARRPRARAGARKQHESEVHEMAYAVANGVYYVTRETLEANRREDLPVPIYIFAAVSYAMEMWAGEVCKQQGWSLDRAHDVQQYLLPGVISVLDAAFSGFDVEHFEAWTAALERAVGEEVAG